MSNGENAELTIVVTGATRSEEPSSIENGEREEGTGIGLAIVRQLVEMQGGQAWVESEEGKGATFHFLWPKRQTSQGSAPTAPAGTASNA